MISHSFVVMHKNHPLYLCIMHIKEVTCMDEMLERILSLIPKKENGEFAYGEKSKFCKAIDVPNQKLSDWIAGRSDTYQNYVYQIAEAYHVSPEWIKTGVTKDEALDRDREDWIEEREMLQTIRDKGLRNQMALYKRASVQQIKIMEKFMKSLLEEEDAD